MDSEIFGEGEWTIHGYEFQETSWPFIYDQIFSDTLEYIYNLPGRRDYGVQP